MTSNRTDRNELEDRLDAIADDVDADGEAIRVTVAYDTRIDTDDGSETTVVIGGGR
jgi:hypothetical protein